MTYRRFHERQRPPRLYSQPLKEDWMNSRCSIRISWATTEAYNRWSSEVGRSAPASTPRLLETNCETVIFWCRGMRAECASTLSMMSE
eukprot:scaffold7412_cov123-Isochrysis_galbana.AAC.8